MPRKPNVWLCKTEPDCYNFDRLVEDTRTVWDGVSNAAANIHLRAMRPGDLALIYHTADQKRIAGLAKVVSDPYEDPANPGLNKKGDIASPVVDVEPVRPARKPLTLNDIKLDPRYAIDGFDLVRLPRLSVMPVPPEAWALIKSDAGL